MRYLYLDDSGKAVANHPSRAVVFAGFSVDHDQWHRVVRQVTGAKARFVPRRGHPAKWELKGSDFLTANAWKRASNRDLCFEIVDILRRNDCRIHSAGIIKKDVPRPLDEKWAVPSCLRAITARFASELEFRDSPGTIVCDWSNYSLDQHVSNCVQTFILRHQLRRISGGVTYGSSLSLGPIQMADIIACAFRMSAEGYGHHSDFVSSLGGLRWSGPGRRGNAGAQPGFDLIDF